MGMNQSGERLGALQHTAAARVTPVAPPLPLQRFLAQSDHVAGKGEQGWDHCLGAGVLGHPPPFPPPSRGVRVPFPLSKSLLRDQKPFLINANPAQTALGEEWEVPTPSMARLLLCMGAGRDLGPVLPAIEVTDEWDVPDAPHSLAWLPQGRRELDE